MEAKMREYAIIDNYLCIKMPAEVDHHKAAGIREVSGVRPISVKIG